MSIKVRDDYGSGGAGLNGPGAATALHRPISEVLRGLVDDDDAALPAAIASADGVAAAGANPTKAEYDVVVTLVNEIKASLNAAITAAGTKSVIKG